MPGLVPDFADTRERQLGPGGGRTALRAPGVTGSVRPRGAGRTGPAAPPLRAGGERRRPPAQAWVGSLGGSARGGTLLCCPQEALFVRNLAALTRGACTFSAGCGPPSQTKVLKGA